VIVLIYPIVEGNLQLYLSAFFSFIAVLRSFLILLAQIANRILDIKLEPYRSWPRNGGAAAVPELSRFEHDSDSLVKDGLWAKARRRAYAANILYPGERKDW
jgi:hypothetical protein